jgi:RluA family pseudouridine synthase
MKDYSESGPSYDDEHRPVTLDPITILHEEPSFLVVNKPSGLLTQASPGVPSLATMLEAQLIARDGNAKRPYIGLPHRLDRGTSGALLIARNERALKRFGAQFQSGKIEKTYLAFVENSLATPSGRWVDYLCKIPDQPKAAIVASTEPDARLASLSYEVISNQASGSLVKITLETGRMHQIRIQFASRGHPLYGDHVYGSEQGWGASRTDPFYEQFALHAWQIAFHHPLTAKRTLVEAPLPASWRTLDLVLDPETRALIRL